MKNTNKAGKKNHQNVTITQVQPEAVQPEAVQPEAVQPEAVQPEAVQPMETVSTESEAKAEAKAKAKAEARQKQINALLAIGLTLEQAEKAVSAIVETIKPAKTGNARVTEAEERIIKLVIDRAKIYNDIESKATGYTVEPVVHELPSDWQTIGDKITEKVSYFKPNAGKTGKTCLTSESEAIERIKSGYIDLITSLYNKLPKAGA